MEEKDDWQLAEDMAKKHEESSSLWLKLANDGDKAVVVFLGGPYSREMCFVEGKYVLYDEAQKAAGNRSSLRVAINVALFDTKEVKVFEQGVTVFKDLVRIRQKYGLDKWAFEIERHGAAKDPKTTYSILPDQQLTAAQISEFQALARHELEEVYAAAESDDLDSYDRKDGTASPGTASAKTGVPERAAIDDTTVATFTAHLKALPRAAVERFCSTFGIARIKELTAAQLPKAREVLAALVAEHEPQPATTVETDPFA